MIRQSATEQSIEQGIYPLYVVYGKDRWTATEKVAQITAEVLADSDPQVALSSYEADEVELADVLDALRTAPFLSERRLVVVRQADSFIRQYRSALEAYLQNPCDTGVLLLVAESFPGNTKLARIAAQIGKVYACEPVNSRELPGVLIGYAQQRHGMKLTRPAADLLIEFAGDEAGTLCSEIDKLTAYLNDPVSPKQQIEPEDVQRLVGHNRQYNVFNVIDAMTAGQVNLALQRLDLMLSQDNDAQFRAVGAFAWHFRRLYHARLMTEQRADERTILRQLRIWPPQQKEFIRQVKQLSIEKIGDCLRNLRDIDLAGKTGAGTVRRGLEKFIVDFCLKNAGAAS